MIETKGTKYKKWFIKVVYWSNDGPSLFGKLMIIMVIIMETLFAFLNVQLQMSLRIGNLQLAAWDWIIQKSKFH